MLYSSDYGTNIKDANKDGEINSKDAVSVKTKGLLNQLTGFKTGAKYQMYQAIAEEFAQSEDDLLKVFHFAASNSSVEFSLAYFRFNDKNYISLQTFGKPYETVNFSPGADALGIKESDVKKFYHNHTSNSVYGKDYTERRSMGEVNGRPADGDYLRAQGSKISYPEYVFFPNSTNLYNVTQKGIYFIQKINNDYKRLKK